ncbi:hypothetical protein NUW54_g2665 [Trametes sanguinea]|uniref:Uncharacterized protein n=1 Tax=Trametes sanguinea TaxID=158606 RepID=A0ACC1Q4U2_9APHY|nr:hypothetical protein NUW54_g2665 [Trametes sanguinea]
MTASSTPLSSPTIPWPLALTPSYRFISAGAHRIAHLRKAISNVSYLHTDHLHRLLDTHNRHKAMDEFSTIVILPADSVGTCFMDESLPCATPSSVSHPAHCRPNARTGLDSAVPVNEDRPDPTQSIVPTCRARISSHRLPVLLPSPGSHAILTGLSGLQHLDSNHPLSTRCFATDETRSTDSAATNPSPDYADILSPTSLRLARTTLFPDPTAPATTRYPRSFMHQYPLVDLPCLTLRSHRYFCVFSPSSRHTGVYP